MKRKAKEYPRWVYGPYGASMLITRKEDWPSGWTTTPEGVEAAPPTKPPRPVNMGRAEMKKELRRRGIAFSETAADVALWELLADG